MAPPLESASITLPRHSDQARPYLRRFAIDPVLPLWIRQHDGSSVKIFLQPLFKDIISPPATAILTALPPAHAWYAFFAWLPLLQDYAFTRLAAAPLLWFAALALLGLGPHRLVAPAKPTPRPLRRLAAQAAFRKSRRRNPIRHRPSFRHRRYQPSRATLLRSVRWGQPCSRSTQTARPIFLPHLVLHFHAPRARFHRDQAPSNRSRRRTRLSDFDRRLKDEHTRQAWTAFLKKQQDVANREASQWIGLDLGQ